MLLARLMQGVSAHCEQYCYLMFSTFCMQPRPELITPGITPRSINQTNSIRQGKEWITLCVKNDLSRTEFAAEVGTEQCKLFRGLFVNCLETTGTRFLPT